MPLFVKVRSFLRNLFLSRRGEVDLDQEVHSHLEMLIEENIRAGMPPKEAQRAARIELGGIEQVKEQVREKRIGNWLHSVMSDCRQGARQLRKNPGFTAVAILTLALGIGANTSVFSLVYALAIRPLPVKDASSLVSIYQEFRGRRSRGVQGSGYYISYPEYANYRDGSQSFSGMVAYAETMLSLGGTDPQPLPGLLVSCNYFEVLGAHFAAGRGFTSSDCLAPASPVAVLSNSFWQREFGGNSEIIGKMLTLDNQVFTVIGVAGPEFSGTELQVPNVWAPLATASQLMPATFGTRDWLALGNVSWLHVVGRLKPGTTRRRAETELTVLARHMDADYPGRQTVVIVNAAAFLNNPEVRSIGGLFAAGVFVLAGLILLMACANVTNLILSRAAARQQEVVIRLALGASRRRLIRQLLTESVFLAVLGGGAGLIVALWLPPVLVRVLPEIPSSGLPLNFTPNFAVLGYALLVSLAAAVVSGISPALQATKPDLVTALKEEGATAGHSRKRARLRSILVTAEVAGCTLLLVAAGMLERGLHRAETVDPGFITRNVFVISFDLAQKGYDGPRANTFERELHDRLVALPGVTGVTISVVLPDVTGFISGVKIPGRNPENDYTQVLANIVSPDYFKTMGVPILRGHAFTEQEAERPGSAPAVISSAMARRFWGGEDPIGKNFSAAKSLTYQVVGIARDAQNLHLGQTDGPFYYGAKDANYSGAVDAIILLRTASDSTGPLSAISGIAHQIDPSVMVTTEAFEQIVSRQLSPARTGTALVGILGILAMVLAFVGVTGVVSYAASQRLREIGIRMTLGAQPRDLLALLLGQGVKLVGIGLGIGLALGAGAAILLSAADLLFGVSPLDPWAFAGTTLLLAAIALVSMLVPARRAMRVDPMVALRYE
jgi:macrolide transport system ATP-binding/permease protein